MPVVDTEFFEKLTKRLSEIEEFIRANRENLESQKHNDVFSSEQVYWHAGYASALRDIVNVLQGTRKNLAN